MIRVVRRYLGLSGPRMEYTNAASIANKGPSIKVGKLYPTESEALHANNKAIDTTDSLCSTRSAPVETQYSTAPSNIPKAPKDTVARLPLYRPTDKKIAGIATSIDAPAYLATFLARTSGTASVLSRNIEQYPASRPSKVP